ncbi:hypothetical protein [Maridesulfovibrio salexigens]|uniref:Uncharacterized protein n=1 Tax=Maridesulfovibrio salexigens (strain ATCC 14822 / DSM 2638 / NCIMB 8403 / VKM B-1763) TaxID=526222 RepID=C6BVC8_MARSD|nr:hypothetical protein [Maridesulfovibrio salexigens]ACS80103.1 conserved hypothetical protein [Maridesulfovibrio salexigens DSM 2638]
MKKLLGSALILLLVLCLGSIASAEEKKAVPNSKAKPAPVEKVEQSAEKQGVPVAVIHSGDDVLGGTLALKLKENFRKSVLFKLAGKDGKAVRVIIESRSEFNERPEIGSVYSVVWTFAESEGVVPFYLKQELGLVNSRNVENSAAGLMNTTDKVAGEYKYLFE